MLRIGSLCSGYGGLCSLGLAPLIGATVAWHAEYDDAPSKILAHHWPDVPNLRDVTSVDWADVEPVDWLTAGYPCQPFSLAGKRKGSTDERHLWPYVADAIGALRPRGVLLENVAGHVTLGLDVVVGALAEMGYDAVWGVVRASDAGAPHGRARVFVVASDAARLGRGERRAEPARREGRPAPVVGRASAPDPADDGRERLGLARGRRARPADDDLAPADADRHGLQGVRRIDGLGRDPDGRGSADVAWGPYEHAVTRWAAVLGRPAPLPTEPGTRGQPRLSPAFVEWLMGLPEGHVTAVPGLTRSAQLKALGNGVVPQQAVLAVRALLPRITEESAA